MKPHTQVLFDGQIFPPTWSVENYKKAIEYQPLDNDIFIVTFPKSGTTWMAMILHLLKSNCVKNDNLQLSDNVCFLEKQGADALHNYSSPRIIKTHLDFERLPWSDSAKYIFVVRNPFDCVVSLYYHCMGFDHYQFKNGRFEDFFELFMSGQVIMGDYFKHLNSLFNEKGRENVYFVTYEMMKEDIFNVIKRIGIFLGGTFSKNIENDEFILKIIENSSFNSMSQQASLINYGKKSHQFIRKGIIGDYKNHMDNNQYDRMMKKLIENCNESILSLWKQYFPDLIEKS